MDSILRGDLVERAAEAGLRSIFVGFQTLTPGNLARSNKRQNLGRDYTAATDRLHRWKKFEPAWNLVIRAKQLRLMTPLLEGVLSKVTREPGPRTPVRSVFAPIVLADAHEAQACTPTSPVDSC